MKIKRTKLGNGLRVITIPMKDNPTVTVLVLVETGSKYENKANNGLSHFLEHMCFKGTERRPSARAISHELDALGSQYNAFTSQEYTGYYAKADSKHFKQVFDVVSDIYLNSTFPEGEMEKEKGVIVEEINMYEDMPQRHVQDLFMELLYGDQPAGWCIAGTRENVRRMKRKDFVNYKKAHYVPSATTVVIAGSVTESEMLSEAKKVFAKLKNTKKSTKKKVIERQSAPKILLKYKATDQTHLVLGVRTENAYSKNNASLAVLATILGGGMSSRLFIKLREEMGVTYYVKSDNDAYTDHGYFEIRAGVTNARVEEVVREILKECIDLKENLVSDDELNKVKEYIVGTMKLELESTDAYAMFFGGQEVMRKKLEELESMERKIRKVSKEDVRNMAKKIFINKHLNLALIGPFKDSKFLEKGLHF